MTFVDYSISLSNGSATNNYNRILHTTYTGSIIRIVLADYLNQFRSANISISLPTPLPLDAHFDLYEGIKPVENVGTLVAGATSLDFQVNLIGRTEDIFISSYVNFVSTNIGYLGTYSLTFQDPILTNNTTGSNPNPDPSKPSIIPIIAGGAAGGFVLILYLGISIYVRHRLLKANNEKQYETPKINCECLLNENNTPCCFCDHKIMNS